MNSFGKSDFLETVGQNQEEDKKLKVSGMTYLFADAAGVAAGLARGDFKKEWGTVAGLSTWFAGGLAAARYGNPKAEILLRQTGIELQDYLKAQGVEIPVDVRARHALLENPSFVEKVENFLYKHPSETLNAMFGVGALGLLSSGVKKVQAGTHTILPKSLSLKGMRDMSSALWMGGLVLSGALAGLLIKEDPDAREKAKDGSTFEKAWAYVKEKPLRLTGGLYITNNIFTANQAYDDYHSFKGSKKLLKPYYFSGVMAASYVFANSMLMLSSREQSTKQGFDMQQLGALERAAAEVMAAQPPEAQAKLLQGVSAFLAEKKDIKQPPEALARSMAQRIAEITRERLDQAVAQTETLHQAKGRVMEQATQGFTEKEATRREIAETTLQL